MPPLLELHRAIQLLLQAQEYADELNRNPWDFAVGRTCLREAGLTNNDIRWMVYLGLLKPGIESAGPNVFVPIAEGNGRSVIHEGNCFLLTREGYEFARKLNLQQPEQEELRSAFADLPTQSSGSLNEARVPVPPGTHQGPGCKSGPDLLTPEWDTHRRMLLFDRRVVKRFKVPAPNQEIVLATFEEEAWPVRIDDPLPQHVNIVAKQRLHDTITSLNRNQQNRLVRFFGDGSGEAICWEIRQNI